jgi:hypothetical protein
MLGLRCAPGVLLQLAGVWWASSSGWGEVSLAVGVALMAVGTPCSMFFLERYAVRMGRRDSWALLALLGPLGPLAVARLRPTQPLGVDVSASAAAPGAGGALPRSRADRAAGMLLSVLLGMGLCWAAARWLAGPPPPVGLDAASRTGNERLAYERLRSIAEAQTSYRERDWDGDGRKSYADFAVHLWRSVDAQGKPVPVELIPRELGFAMVPEFALDGYVYRSLHRRTASAERDGAAPADSAQRLEPIDAARAWAVVAEPAVPRQTGTLVLLADASRTIWMLRSGVTGMKAVPSNPEAQGWVRVRSASDLVTAQ